MAWLLLGGGCCAAKPSHQIHGLVDILHRHINAFGFKHFGGLSNRLSAFLALASFLGLVGHGPRLFGNASLVRTWSTLLLVVLDPFLARLLALFGLLAAGIAAFALFVDGLLAFERFTNRDDVTRACGLLELLLDFRRLRLLLEFQNDQTATKLGDVLVIALGHQIEGFTSGVEILLQRGELGLAAFRNTLPSLATASQLLDHGLGLLALLDRFTQALLVGDGSLGDRIDHPHELQVLLGKPLGFRSEE